MDILKSYYGRKKSKLQPRRSFSQSKTRPGFTIVELLIVVVVIAILAAITLVSYNGIANRADASAVKSDLKTAATKVAMYKVDNDSYPSSLADTDLSQDTIDKLQYTDGPNAFCVEGYSPRTSNTFHITEFGEVRDGECPPPPMQNFTPNSCATLAIYTGSNEDAIITLVDSRGTPQTYKVAKLADGNCWMLDNLKLGSETSTLSLTPSDTDVASNFNLPQLFTTGTEYNNPRVYGPVTGDTGAGETSYGYMYNWPAATAGQTTTTMPAGAGDAPHSICPAGWHLPTGGSVGELAMLNARMQDPNATTPKTYGGAVNWRYTGQFKGVYSGYRKSSFFFQGSSGYLWSSTAHTSDSGHAFYASYNNQGGMSAGDVAISRYYGMAIRCLLN